MQLGFALDWADPASGEVVPWADPTADLLKKIAEARWKIVDTETTGLNPASPPINVSNRDLRRGVDPTPRLRVVSVLFPDKKCGGISTVSFDMDRLAVSHRREVCDASLTGDMIAHNAGYDAGWLRTYSNVRPRRILDSMLIARVMYPQQPLEMAKLANDENVDVEVRTLAKSMFEQGRSGWALADLALTVLGRIVSKEAQGPRNWCEPFLTQDKYDYATGDVRLVYDLLTQLFRLQPGDDLIEAYEKWAIEYPALKLVEPQVADVLAMRERGMPWSPEEADKYVASQRQKVIDLAAKMVELEPDLKKFQAAMADFDSGISLELTHAIGNAFRKRGLVLETTDKTGQPKIGEKDLRKAKAATTEAAKPLFDTWVALCRAKKAGAMANEFSGYARRSKDGRIHSNIGHGPATGRLSSSEPNVQQAPRDQGFRNAVKARKGVRDAVAKALGVDTVDYMIVACDFSALDMRVAAALAIRAQRQIHAAYRGEFDVADDVRLIINRVYRKEVTLSQAERMEKEANQRWEAWKARREEVADNPNARKAYWDRWHTLQRESLLARFRRCLAYVRMRAEKAGTPEWGSLRDAFSIPGMDIHTWTALSMSGVDPLALFKDKSNKDVVAELKVQKKKLGDKRQYGKVANLSLTYAMKEHGFQDSAAKIYGIHWTLEEAAEVRAKWLASYVEIDLWHCWTELNPHSTVYVPDPDRGNRFVRKPVYAAYTLGGRLIYAFGLNAGLAYEDQSTGADILGTAMDTFRREYPGVYECIVNQVHDEIVFEIPAPYVKEYVAIITKVMVGAAEKFLGPYGVRAECSPAIGDVWLKD